ncbi:ATP-NAD kinase-like domain-containing protein [Fennellomyces sp. T-0311]|nr:ATP-NAD kinase-like domain-containing protein [Fennellomyces sp. T-0311]
MSREFKRYKHEKHGPVPLTQENYTDWGNSLCVKHWMKWESRMDTILIMTKARDNCLVAYTREVAQYIITTQRSAKGDPFTVYVDAHLETSKHFGYQELAKDPVYANHLKFWTPALCYKSPEMFHLIVVLGGDGTVLFTSWLFQTIVPPIIPFHLGSLSFLTPFPFSEYQTALHNLFSGKGPGITLRMRLSCTIYRSCEDPGNTRVRQARQCAVTGAIWTRKAKTAGKDKRCQWQLMETEWMKDHINGHPQFPSGDASHDKQTHDIPCYTTVPCETFEVLNELVVDRGPSPYMATLELFGDEQHLTTVEADGLVISTPTGSTAYSLSAGGSLCHPCVPAILISPICAHTLNFRPMLLPYTTTVRVVVRSSARTSAYCSFDGKYRVELTRGDHVSITFSRYAMPTLSRKDTNYDWFTSLQQCLMWNQRVPQKPFVVVESHKKRKKARTEPASPGSSSDSSESVFACVNDGDDSKKDAQQDQDDDEDTEQGFDLVPWTKEELEREMLSAVE